MAHLLRMPKLSMEMTQGEVLEWHKNEGESVSEGDLLVEVESEKAIGEVEAQQDGVLRRRFFARGTVVEPRTPLGVVAVADADIASLLGEARSEGIDTGEGNEPTKTPDQEASACDQTATTFNQGAGADDEPSADRIGAKTEAPANPSGAKNGADGATEYRVTPSGRRRARELDVDLDCVRQRTAKSLLTVEDVEAIALDENESSFGGVSPAVSGRNEASPNARRLAADHDIDIGNVAGSGPDGAVVGQDVIEATNQQVSDVEGAATRTVASRTELRGMRRAIADRLGESYRNVVHVTLDREVDADKLVMAANVADRALDQEVSVVDVLLVALSEALAEHPTFNATFEDGVHETYEEHNFGVAVDVEDGLVAPVLEDVRMSSIAVVARRRRSLIDRTLAGEYTGEDLRGGTFTVTNLGALGIDSFSPIINAPQVAILGVGRIREEAVPNELGEVTVTERVSLSLSFDHRVADGADAARFLGTLAKTIEHATDLLVLR